MAASDSRKNGRTALEIIEEAVALLRKAPAGAIVAYYLGAIPFWLALLYFLSDMSRNGFAVERLPSSSLGVAALFIWMKCWHAFFAAGLRSCLLIETETPWTPGRIGRLVLAQAALQPWGLILRPLAANILLPFCWVSSFFQNVTVLGDGTPSRDGSIISRACGQAALWAGQAHLVIVFLTVFGFFIWLNVIAALLAVPALLKIFFGLETMATRGGTWAFFSNTTFLMVTVAVTCLCLDPLWKAAYVLRCFYGDSRRNGADLRLQLRTLSARAPGAALLVSGLALVLLVWTAPARAAEPPPAVPASAASVPAAPPAAGTIDPQQLERSIGKVLDGREFAWRMPREAQKAKKGLVDSWLDDVLGMVRDAMRKLWHWFSDFWEWLRRRFRPKESEDTGSSLPPIEEIMYVLIAVGCGLLGWAIYRAWGKNRRQETIEAEAVQALPDLDSEDVAADQLPEDGWLQFARDLMGRGEFRLALRAAYLAGLAHLGQRELLTIARHKSNRDYDRELRRRARSHEALLEAFAENLLAFERSWYGEHEVTHETLAQFTQNLEKMRTC